MKSASVTALATRQAKSSHLSVAVNKENLIKEIKELEKQFLAIYRTLSMLNDSQNFDAFLGEILNAIALKTGNLLRADRTSIFMLDEAANELWSLIAKDDGNASLEIRLPANQGIAGEVATTKRSINIPYDFYNDPRSETAKDFDKKNKYRTYTMLTLPLSNEQGNLVAVVQLVNKLKKDGDPEAALDERIDRQGFGSEDEDLFQEFCPVIRLILESSHSFYLATQRQRAGEALLEATRSLASSSLDLESTLNRVMDAAKKLMNADRSTLWLLDRERDDLWANIQQPDGSFRELRVPVGRGYVGKVARSGRPLNITFDLYKDGDSVVSQQVDQQNGYRTCSLLCMPIFNAEGELIGVTQLVNKKKQGDFAAYNPQDWPHPPECWKASFNRSDEEFMEAFNIQAGVAIQNAKLFEKVKQQYAKIQQQEQMQRDILRSLSNGVISTNAAGEIMAANPSAKKMLGFGETDALEGKSIQDLVRFKEGDFSAWLQAALKAGDEKARQQYYPDRTLLSAKGDANSVHLSINSIADASDPRNVYGALVVMDDISDAKRLKSTMYRYMTQELAEQLLQSGDAKLGGDRKKVSILFSDIRGYTNLVEKMDAEEVVTMLNEYFSSMVDAIFKYKGTLDKYIGDALMGVFGSPLPLEDHAWSAVQTALEMRSNLAEFNASRQVLQKSPIRIGIGIHSGEAISGNIGHQRRMEFTVIGDDVNLASRLEGTTKLYGCDIAIGGNTYQACADRILVRELDIVQVKGRIQPVTIYELIGQRGDRIPAKKQQIVELYQQGRELYLHRQFATAWQKFEAVLAIDSQDKPAQLHQQRCQKLMSNLLPDNWDGVETLTEK